jgi:hypothetical protein
VQAAIVLRCIKFRLRWPDLYIDDIARWTETFSENLGCLEEDGWDRLVSLRNRCVPEAAQGDEEHRIAEQLGDFAVSLVKAIAARLGAKESGQS